MLRRRRDGPRILARMLWFSLIAALLLLGCTSGGPADSRDPGCVAFDKQVQFVSWSADGSRAAVLAENGGLADLVTVSWPKLEVAPVVSGITIFTDVSGVDAAGAAFWIDNDPSWDARLHLKAPGGADRIIRLAHPRYLGIWMTDAGIFVLTYLPPELSGSTEQTFLSRASLVRDRLVDGDVLVQVDDRPMTAWVDPAGTRWVTTEATSETGDIAVRVWVDGSQVAEVPLAGAHDVSLGPSGDSIIYTSDLALHEISDLGAGSDTVISGKSWFSASVSVQGVIAGIAPSSSGRIKACFEALGSPEPTSTAVH